MKRYLITVCLVVLAVSGALAQQKSVPPPPKPTDDGPSLEVTMDFIQDKLNDVGPVNFVLYMHDNIVGNDWTNQFSDQVTRVVADARACRIRFHWKSAGPGSTQEIGSEFRFKDVHEVVVMTEEELQKEITAAAGHPAWSVRADPPVFVLKVRRSDKATNEFDFLDRQTADRVAKAMIHAVELCGGGKKEPF